MYEAKIRADSSLDWYGVLWAVNQAANQMQDCEDTEQSVEMPDGEIWAVDLDAGGRDEPNVYLVTAQEVNDEP